MKNLQKNTLKRILEVEQFTISALASITEINRGYLSKLLNHNTQLNERDWKILSEAYSEHLQYEFDAVSKKTVAKLAEPKSKKAGSKDKQQKILVVETVEQHKEELPEVKLEDLKIKKNINLKEIKADIKIAVENLPDAKKEIKTKEANRHRNMNCPESGYHMKVPYRDLVRARPLCPLTQLPMMLKEEIKKYKYMDELQRKEYIKDLTSTINLLKI